ncbi:MAG: NAD-glutamate dehydrogenase, partial [Hyphomonas sp.]
RIVQTDAPFLVDSVMGALAEAGVSVRALFHPVVELDDRRLSVIMLVIDGAPQERRDALGEGLAECLTDVHAAVADHEAMTGLMRQAMQRLEATPPTVDPAVLAENIAFLKWLKSDHFVFLGARDYNYPLNADGDYEAEAPLSQSSAGLGILADPDRTVLRRASEPAVLTRQMRRQLDLSEPVTVA